jgi:hypothetical protein
MVFPLRPDTVSPEFFDIAGSVYGSCVFWTPQVCSVIFLWLR